MNEHNILIDRCEVVSMREDMPRNFIGSIGITGNKIVLVEPEGSPDIDSFRLSAQRHHLTVIEGAGMVALPGLINTHNHVAMTLLRGYGDDMPLMEWLNDKIWPFEELMTAADIITGAKLGVAEMLLGGTTTFVDMYRMEASIAQAVKEGGIRAVLTSSVTDNWLKEFDKDIQEIDAIYKLAGSDMLRFMLAPHAPYTNSESTLLRIKTLAERYDLGINIHVAETRDEIEIIRKKYDKTPVKFLDDLGLIDERTIAAHCVWLTDQDIEILSARGTSVAHCPESNMKLASGISPIDKMMKMGVNVSLGTDGPASNNDMDMWEEMRSASFLQKLSTLQPNVLSAYQTLKMATVNGAKAIGMGGKLGVLKPDSLADLILINAHKPHLFPVNDIISNLVYSSKSSDVNTVIIDGRIVVSGGELLTMDTAKLCLEAQQSADRIKSEIS